MEIGAGVCRPSGAPLCETCPLRSFCGAYAALQAGTIPAIESIIPLKAARMKKRDEHVVSVIHELPSETGRKFVVVRRPEDGLLGGMLEFPSVVCLATQAVEVSATLSCACTSLKRVGSFKHIFSHVDMTVDVFHAKWAVPEKAASGSSKKPVGNKESLEKSVKAAVVKALNDLNNQKVNVDSVSVKTEDELKQSATSRVLWKSFELIGGAPKTTKKRSRSSITE
ncbi:NUDIX domain containing protein, putative [Angomonas deanei]|uniref:NUDIX domain containing protein, putative n=1 Tax=Angomonas deanei TaxID=59799 RepID=A0A7G2CIC4_9TRYP|nr:NUDIX domain containing protein, putative [Angomonas deanei]